MNEPVPELLSILETALYVDDLGRAAAFYEGVMGLSPLYCDDRLCAYNLNDRSVLLLFMRGGTVEPVQTGGGLIPPHNGSGSLHMAFSATHASLLQWRAHLEAAGIEIEGTSNWKRGGQSLYFRDPDGNLLEVATTPGLWEGFYRRASRVGLRSVPKKSKAKISSAAASGNSPTF